MSQIIAALPHFWSIKVPTQGAEAMISWIQNSSAAEKLPTELLMKEIWLVVKKMMSSMKFIKDTFLSSFWFLAFQHKY